VGGNREKRGPGLGGLETRAAFIERETSLRKGNGSMSEGLEGKAREVEKIKQKKKRRGGKEKSAVTCGIDTKMGKP